jgi:hypothetical protein
MSAMTAKRSMERLGTVRTDIFQPHDNVPEDNFGAALVVV